MRYLVVLALAVAGALAAGESADPRPCQSVLDFGSIILGRYLGVTRDCADCSPKISYEYLETLSGPPAKLDGRIIDITGTGTPDESPIQLIAITSVGSHHYAMWVRPARETDPVVTHLRRQRETPRASVTIEATDGHGAITGVSVTLTAAASGDPDEEALRQISGSDGAARFEDLLPGTYYYTVDAANHERSRGSVSLIAGSCPVKVSHLRPRNRMSGKLLDFAGNPVSGVAMSLASEDGRRHFGHGVWTAADGSFAFDSIPAGRYRLGTNLVTGGTTLVPRIYYPKANLPEDAEVFTVAPDTQRPEIVFHLPDLGRRREIEVEARDGSGKPIEFSAAHQLAAGAGPPIQSGTGGGCFVPAPRFGPRSPLRITVFDNLAYGVVPLTLYSREGAACQRAAPVTLPAGSKADKVIVTYDPARCDAP